LKRFPFLDWMRGLAVVIMIQCHTFNSFTRPELRQQSGYILSQFIGGMAAPLFLFMAGMTTGFGMESAQLRGDPVRRWLVALRRAGYILGIAYLFRFTNWAAGLPSSTIQELLKVDILNCMGLALIVFSFAALLDSAQRIRWAIVGALAVAAAAPVMSGLDWSGVLPTLRDYLVPSPLRGRFPFFPCASYVGFGLAAGSILKQTGAERLDRIMQWGVLAALALIFGAQYFADLPYSVYSNSDFWRTSPALILIRVGISLLLLAGAYIWTVFGRAGWSWVETLGKTSLMVYWVHVMLVYGDLAKFVRQALTIPQAAAATAIVTLLMIALAEAKLRWQAHRAERWKAETTVARPA
jgi:uncharacterized membrane protein